MNRILICIEQSENRRLLAECLGRYYEVVVAGYWLGGEKTVSVLDEPFDLCIVDGPALDRLWESVQAKKQAEHPVFLPVLLIAVRSDVKLLTRHLWQTIDELISKPIEKPELHARVEMLLRARRISLQLQVALNRERELQELKSRFVSMVSHEFRNPLHTISGFSRLLEKQQLPPEKQASFLQRIQSAVSHMVALLDNVLTLSKSEAESLTLNPVSLEIVPFCQRLIEDIKVGAGTNHTLLFDCEDECFTVQTDETLVRQILTNLLSNAIKYSAPDTTIKLKLKCRPSALIFSVQDEGIGITKADRERLFESFYRASNASNIPGTGLGLAIVKQAVERQGGSISVTSELNVGTTFTVTLPYTFRDISER